MIDVEKLRKSKGRRIYLFWLDEKNVVCKKNNMIAVRSDDWCSRAERKEE